MVNWNTDDVQMEAGIHWDTVGVWLAAIFFIAVFWFGIAMIVLLALGIIHT